MERNPEREESPLAKKAKLPDGPAERVEAQNEGIRPESNHHAANQNQHHNVKKEALGPNTRALKKGGLRFPEAAFFCVSSRKNAGCAAGCPAARPSACRFRSRRGG